MYCCFFRGLRGSHDLGFARGESYALLLLRAPGDRGLVEEEDPAAGGVPGLSLNNRVDLFATPRNVSRSRESDRDNGGLGEQPLVAAARRATHRATKHADGVANVRARVGRAVQQGANKALVLPQEFLVDVVRVEGKRVGDVLRQVLVVGQLVTLRGRAHAVGEMVGHHLLDVAGLRELDDAVLEGEVDAEEVGELALVLDAPLLESGRELVVDSRKYKMKEPCKEHNSGQFLDVFGRTTASKPLVINSFMSSFSF